MKILFVAQNLQMGGIQKALINTLKELNSKNEQKHNTFEIDLFVFGDGILAKELPNNINVYRGSLLLRLISTPFFVVKDSGNLHHIILRVLCMVLVRIIGSEKLYRLLFRWQNKLSRYDYAISYFNDVQNGYFNRGTSQFVDEFVVSNKKIAWMHTDPLKAGYNRNSLINTYKDFHGIVCVSEANKKNLIELMPEFMEKIFVVNNFFPIEEIKTKAMCYIPFEKKEFDIVSVGRIDNSTKRFHLIPEICKMLKDVSITNFHWRIVGDGPDLEKNKQLANVLGVSDLVEFVGQKDNPYPFINSSDLFVLTSAYEGYPMVVLESLILGTPVLTTNYSSVSEQVVDGYNGTITGMELADIYEQIKNILIHPEILFRMKQNLKNDNFSNDRVLQQFLSCLSN
jgi:glycosyltransferase involved in cell wall biosynthesis